MLFSYFSLWMKIYIYKLIIKKITYLCELKKNVEIKKKKKKKYHKFNCNIPVTNALSLLI